MGKFFNSLTDTLRYAEENFKKSYFTCSCALGQSIIYFVDEFISPLQLSNSIEPVFYEAQNNFGTDWKTALFEMTICGGKIKKSISVHANIPHELYDKMYGMMDRHTIFEHIGNALKSELFIHMVNHLGER